jgi:hypothetical protein
MGRVGVAAFGEVVGGEGAVCVVVRVLAEAALALAVVCGQR